MCYRKGRPDVPVVLGDWSVGGKKKEKEEEEEEEEKERRGVIVCGPDGMLGEVRGWVVGRKGKVDLHEEVFRW